MFRQALGFTIAFAVLIGAVAVAAPPTESKDKKAAPKKRKSFTIGKDTTFVEGPLDKDGFIDYETALNEILSKGVTPENNAAVLLFKAFGPHPDGAKISDEFFKWLKIAPPPEKGDYFLDQSFVHKKLQKRLTPDPQKNDDWFEREIEAVTKRPWDPPDHPEVAEWLKLNEKPLAVAIEASKRTHYYYPLLATRKDGKSAGLISATLVGVQSSRQLATALAARALLRVHEKRYDDAWQDLLACHRLGRLVGRGGTLIEGLIGIALDRVACDADLAFLDAAKLDAKQLQKCRADLLALPPMPAMADKMNLTERFWFLEMVMIVDREGIAHLHTLTAAGQKPEWWENAIAKIVFSNLQWDTALRNSNKLYDRIHTAMALKDRTKRAKEFDSIQEDIREVRIRVVVKREEIVKEILGAKNMAEAKGKFIGDMMVALLVPAFARVQQSADMNEQTHTNLQIGFALAAHRADHGKYPKTLDALTPKYLPSVPADLFSGKAPIYRPAEKGYLLYSVGVNGQDDGGRTREEDADCDDLPVRMPLPNLPKN
jgi:hypothetical protein